MAVWQSRTACALACTVFLSLLAELAVAEPIDVPQWQDPEDMFEMCDEQDSQNQAELKQVWARLNWIAHRWCTMKFLRGWHERARTHAVHHSTCCYETMSTTDFTTTVGRFTKPDFFNFTALATYNGEFGCQQSKPGIDPDGNASKVISALDYGSHEFPESKPPTKVLEHIVEEFISKMWTNNSGALLISHDGQLIAERYRNRIATNDWPGFPDDWPTFGNYSEDAANYRLQFYGTLPLAIISILMEIRGMEQEIDLHSTTATSPELDRMQKLMLNMTIGAILDHNLKHYLSAENRNKLLWQVQTDSAKFTSKCLVHENDDTNDIDPEGVATISLLTRELRYTFANTGDGRAEYAAYPWAKLFSKIGAKSFVFEADGAGNFEHAGVWASPRDYLRFGAMLAQGGYWQGEQVIPALSKFLREGRHIINDGCRVETWWGKGFFFHEGPPVWYAVASNPWQSNKLEVVYNIIAICESCNMSIVHLSRNMRDAGQFGVKGIQRGTACDEDGNNATLHTCTLHPPLHNWCVQYAEDITRIFREYQSSRTSETLTSTLASSSTTENLAWTTASSSTTSTTSLTAGLTETTFKKPDAEDISNASGLRPEVFSAVLLMQLALAVLVALLA